MDWTDQELEPGFSIWMLIEKTETSTSAFMKGYTEIPSAIKIIAKTKMLLEGTLPN